MLRSILLVSLLMGFAGILLQPRNALASEPYSYVVIDLGTLGGNESSAASINDIGQVAGGAATAGGDWHAYRTAPYSPIDPATSDLGVLDFSGSVAINVHGQVAGNAVYRNFPVVERTFRSASNTGNLPWGDPLGTLGGARGWAGGINDSGQIVGSAERDDLRIHAYRTAPNSAINPATDDLGTLGGPISQGLGINQSGQVVGVSETASDKAHAFRTAPNSPINPATDDLGTLGGNYSEARDINQLGFAVGVSEISAGNLNHAFLVPPNRSIDPATDDLGDLYGEGSEASALNDAGHVVGFSHLSGPVEGQRAWIWVNGDMTDLNSLIDPSLGWDEM